MFFKNVLLIIFISFNLFQGFIADDLNTDFPEYSLPFCDYVCYQELTRLITNVTQLVETLVKFIEYHKYALFNVSVSMCQFQIFVLKIEFIIKNFLNIAHPFKTIIDHYHKPALVYQLKIVQQMLNLIMILIVLQVQNTEQDKETTLLSNEYLLFQIKNVRKGN